MVNGRITINQNTGDVAIVYTSEYYYERLPENKILRNYRPEPPTNVAMSPFMESSPAPYNGATDLPKMTNPSSAHRSKPRRSHRVKWDNVMANKQFPGTPIPFIFDDETSVIAAEYTLNGIINAVHIKKHLQYINDEYKIGGVKRLILVRNEINSVICDKNMRSGLIDLTTIREADESIRYIDHILHLYNQS